MGKRSRKQKEDDQGEVSTTNEMVCNTNSKNSKQTEIYPKSNRIKKSKNISLGIESKPNSLTTEKRSKNVEVMVPTKIQEHKPSSLATDDVTAVEATFNVSKKSKKKKFSKILDTINDENSHQEVAIDSSSSKSKRQKIKQKIVNSSTEIVSIEREQLPIANSKKKKNRTKQETVSQELNGEKSSQETLNISHSIEEKNTIHNKVENSERKTNNDKKEKPKKKKKRETIEEEVVDDAEIDRYCDELDDFHNKQYENWVKLIEENFNKKVKKYLFLF